MFCKILNAEVLFVTVEFDIFYYLESFELNTASSIVSSADPDID